MSVKLLQLALQQSVLLPQYSPNPAHCNQTATALQCQCWYRSSAPSSVSQSVKMVCVGRAHTRARARAHTQSLTYTQSTTRKNVQICSFFICTETSITAVVKLFPGAVYANDTVGRLREVRHPVRLPFPVVLPNFPPVIHGPG